MTYPHQRTEPTRRARPPVPPFPEDPTTATRHLCAGAYLDDTFRNDVLRRVYYQARRIVAPSHGFDAVPVLGHCLRARDGAIVRDAAILLTVVVAACVSWTALFLVLISMAQLQLTVTTYRLFRDTFRKLRNGQSISLGGLAPRAFLLVLGWALTGFLSFGVTFALVQSAIGSLGTDPAGGFPGDYQEAESAITRDAMLSILLALAIFVFPVAFTLWRQTELARLTPGGAVVPPVRNTRLEEVARQQRGNTTVYSGFQPYVGSGPVIDSWSFAQRLVRAEPPGGRELDGLRGTLPERDREFPAAPFDAQELIDYVHGHLATLLPPREAEEHIPGLSVEDRVCLAGTEVSFLTPHTAPEVMAAVIRHPTTPARHYLACQVFAWGGELITTVYVHIAVQGRSLFLEMTTTALPPCDERYRIVDTVDGTGPMAWLRAVKNGLIDTPRTIWRSPLNLTAALINLVAGSTSGTGEGVRLQRGYDYGAQVGIRELGSEPGMRFLTQMQDVEKYQKLIERRVLDSVLDFLDERGIDTGEYRERAASVFFNGVTNFGNATYHGPVAGRDVVRGAGR